MKEIDRIHGPYTYTIVTYILVMAGVIATSWHNALPPIGYILSFGAVTIAFAAVRYRPLVFISLSDKNLELCRTFFRFTGDNNVRTFSLLTIKHAREVMLPPTPWFHGTWVIMDGIETLAVYPQGARGVELTFTSDEKVRFPSTSPGKVIAALRRQSK